MALGGSLAAAGSASAHVTVVGDDLTVRGGTNAVITFRVPTESDTLSTVGLRVVLPTETPFAAGTVTMRAMPGWTETVKTATLATPVTTAAGTMTAAVSELTWTAAAGYEIKPGSFTDFAILCGQLPSAPTLTFKALQTYSNKSVVSWIQTPAAGQDPDELDHPAPILTLNGAAAVGAAGSTTVATSSSSTLPTVLAVVAVLVALATAALVVLGRRRPTRGAAERATAPVSTA